MIQPARGPRSLAHPAASTEAAPEQEPSADEFLAHWAREYAAAPATAGPDGDPPISAEELALVARYAAPLFGLGVGYAVNNLLRFDVTGEYRGAANFHGLDVGAIPGGGSADPISEKVVCERSHYMKMAGREVFKAAVLTMAEACDEALRRAGISADEVDVLIPHQANIRIIEATAKHAGMPMDKVMVNVDRFGNTSSASIPLALDQAIAEGRVKSGSVILLVAFGAGFTWGSSVIRW